MAEEKISELKDSNRNYPNLKIRENTSRVYNLGGKMITERNSKI